MSILTYSLQLFCYLLVVFVHPECTTIRFSGLGLITWSSMSHKHKYCCSRREMIVKTLACVRTEEYE